MDIGFNVLGEGETATELGWISRLGGSADVFNELLADGILRYSGGSRNGRTFTLNFVGLMVIGSAVSFSFPKASNFKRWTDADIVLKAIVEYRRKITRLPSVADFSAAPVRLYKGTLVDTFSALVLWTLERGFHHQAISDSRSLHEGVDWARTISSTPAMHGDSSVVYPEPISRIQTQSLSDLAEIQAFALLDMRRRLGAFAVTIAPDVEELWERCADVLEHGRTEPRRDTMEGLIEDQAGITNRDEELDLITILREWLEEKWTAGPRVLSFGISGFHTVWEDICAQAMSSFGTPVSHADLASQPSYVISGVEIALTPQRPDILLERSGSVVVADAKWYLLDQNVLPQTPDAVKQFVYEAAIKPSMEVKANLLMLPSEASAWWNIVGALHMTHDGHSDMRFRPVTVVAINWLYLIRMYVSHECLPDTFLADILAERAPALTTVTTIELRS